jgi:hypothetical protein
MLRVNFVVNRDKFLEEKTDIRAERSQRKRNL